MADARYDGTGAFLAPEELRAWTALLDVSRILDTELERDLVADHDMTHREYEVLVRIDGGGGSMRMSALAAQIETSGPLVSQTVARLEGRGLVERQRAADDRRGVDAQITDAGRTLLRKAAEPHAEIIRRLYTSELGAELEAVGAALTRVADHLRAHRREGSCDDPNCRLFD